MHRTNQGNMGVYRYVRELTFHVVHPASRRYEPLQNPLPGITTFGWCDPMDSLSRTYREIGIHLVGGVSREGLSCESQ